MFFKKGMARERIAYVTPNAILPPNRGGRIRTHHLWRAMSAYAEVVPIIVGDTPFPMLRTLSRQAQASFLPRRRYHSKRLLDALAAAKSYVTPGLWEVLGVEGLPDDVYAALEDAPALVRHALNDRRVERIVERVRRSGADVVVLCDSSMGLLAPAMRAIGDIKLVVGPHNFDSALYETMSRTAPSETLRRWNRAAAKAFAAAEQIFAPHVDQLWVCSAYDKERFSALIPRDKIRIVPNVCDVPLPTPIPDTRDLVFVGQGNYFPNEDAAHRLLNLSAQLDARGVAHRLKIVGRAAASVIEAAKRFPSVDVLGEVPSVIPYIENAFAVPIALTLGGGTRLKIIEAMAAGRPIVSTPIGIEGIDARHGVHAIIEPDIDAFPDRIVELFSDRERAQAMADAAWTLARTSYSHEALVGIVGHCLGDLGLGRTVDTERSFAANLGAIVRTETAIFNPVTRLLTWTFKVRLAATFGDLSGEFGSVDGVDLPNAFVTLKQDREGFVIVEAAAVLSGTVAPESARVDLYAWGRRVLSHKAPDPVARETAGLLSVERDGDGLRVTGWSAHDVVRLGLSGGGAPIQSIEAPTAPNGIFDCRLPSAAGTVLALEAAEGFVQTLHKPIGWISYTRPANARLRSLADRHRGETAWIIGNGPSVRIEDLDALEGRLTFCFNRFHMAYDQTRLRPTYTVTGDKQMIEDFGQQIVDVSGGTVFVVHDYAPDLVGNYIWVRMLPIFPPLFSKNADFVVSPGGSSLFMAMQIGYMMGIRQFYLYGMDFRFVFEKTRGGDKFRTATGDQNHFISNYRNGKPWCPPSLKDIGAGFHTARCVIEAEGGFVRNASRGGLMEMFERTSFEAALPTRGAAQPDMRVSA